MKGRGFTLFLSLIMPLAALVLMSMSAGLAESWSNPLPMPHQPNRTRTTANTTERVSVDSNGVEGNHWSERPAISDDGRYVAFQSLANNLVLSDTNTVWDIYLHDRETNLTERISSDGSSTSPDISADGRYVAFDSYSANLVLSDTNGVPDVFIHDRWTGVTELVSVNSAGQQGNDLSLSPSISADGRYVAFKSYATNLGTPGGSIIGFYVRDRELDTTERADINESGQPGNDYGSYLDISADGRYVVFDSYASNLITGDTNGKRDIFLRDWISGTTERVSVDSAGQAGNDNSYDPAISDDGRYVAFYSYASNLAIGDTNGESDVFLHDRTTGLTKRVSVSSAGGQSNTDSNYPAISGNGRFVAFQSRAYNLVSGDDNNTTDTFVHDQSTGLTYRASISSDGEEGNNASGGPALSVEGQIVAFESDASNLVTGDTNDLVDIFVHQWSVHRTFLPLIPFIMQP